MGLLIKGLLGALVVVLIGVLAKTKTTLSLAWSRCFHLCAHRPLYCRQRAGDRSPARDHRIRHVVDSSYFIYLLSLWYFTGIMRLPLALAGAVGCWGCAPGC